MLKDINDYLDSFWNMIDIVSLALNISYLVMSLLNVRKENIRPLGATIIIVMWIRFFYFLRLFKSTASLVRTIVQIIKDIRTFGLIFLLSILAFGNSYYLLSIISYDYENCELNPEHPPCQTFTGKSYLLSLMYTFKSVLGDFDTAGYDEQDHTWIIWVVFVLSVVIVQIVLLNMLIAIMADSFNRVTEISE